MGRRLMGSSERGSPRAKRTEAAKEEDVKSAKCHKQVRDVRNEMCSSAFM